MKVPGFYISLNRRNCLFGTSLAPVGYALVCFLLAVGFASSALVQSSPVLAAIRKGDTSAALEESRQAQDLLHLHDGFHRSLIHFAAYEGRAEIVRGLLDFPQARADLKSPSDNGMTALSASVSRGHTVVATLLLQRGANPNQQDAFGLAPLHWAAIRGNTSIALQLLKHGAAINLPDRTGMRPLHLAVRHGHLRFVQFLLSLKGSGGTANINQPDGFRMTPLHWAVSNHRERIVAFLLGLPRSRGLVNAPDTNRWTPLHLAAFTGRTKIARLLLDRGANPAARTVRGQTAADIASENGYPDLATLLRRK